MLRIYNYTTQYTNCAVYIYFPFHNVNIFPRLLYNCLFHYVYSEASLDTYTNVYNYTTQYADFSVYICFPFHNVNIFPQLLYNCLFHYVYSEAPLDTYSTVYNYSPQYTVCAVYICCPFHNVIFFHNYWTIDSTTMSTAYPQHIHIVLFTTTLHSILALLFIYASFTQCDIFSQLLHNWLYNNVYSISSTYTYDIVYNYTTQYTDFAVYICFLYTMWHFFTITAQLTLQQCLQHIRNIYI